MHVHFPKEMSLLYTGGTEQIIPTKEIEDGATCRHWQGRYWCLPYPAFCTFLSLIIDIHLRFGTLLCHSKLQKKFEFGFYPIIFHEGMVFELRKISQIVGFSHILAHLSWKLKWTFLIAYCPSSVCLSVWRLASDVSLSDFYIFDFFSRTAGPFVIKAGKNHPWVKGIQNSSYEG
jgi:hypothetical protein